MTYKSLILARKRLLSLLGLQAFLDNVLAEEKFSAAMLISKAKTTMKSLVLLMVLALAGVATPAEFVNQSGSEPKDMFILAGQSNMAGRGGVVNSRWDGIVPPECQPNPSILRLSAGLAWEKAQEPLHADIDTKKTCGVGPGMAFANALRMKEPRIGVVGLVPCAVGGTQIKQWARGTPLYEGLVRRAKAALKRGGTIRAILWYQGESDTRTRATAEAYKKSMETIISDLRTDLGSATLPIIQVALASGEGQFVETLRKAQLSINLPNVSCVDAKGLGLQPDGLHLSTAAQVRLGGMLADAFLSNYQTPLRRGPRLLHGLS